MKKVKARKDAIQAPSQTGVENNLRTLKNCTVITGHARFESSHEVSVGQERLTAPRIFLNVGGRALIPDFPGLDQIPILHQFLDDARRFPASPPGDRRWQLYRT